jgi:hypothetical protein
LRKFFIIEDDKNVELSLLGKRELKCVNLLLRTDVVNKPNMPVLVKYCSIGLLELSFDKKKSEYRKPLNVKASNIQLTVMLNRDRHVNVEEEENSRKERPVLQRFYEAVGKEEEYQ